LISYHDRFHDCVLCLLLHFHVITNSAVAEIQGDVQFSGRTFLNNGVLSISSSNLQLASSSILKNNASMNWNETNMVYGNGSVWNYGRFRMFDTTKMYTNFSASSSSIISIEIKSTIATIGFPQISMNQGLLSHSSPHMNYNAIYIRTMLVPIFLGVASLNGTLEIYFVDGYSPSSNDSYEIIFVQIDNSSISSNTTTTTNSTSSNTTTTTNSTSSNTTTTTTNASIMGTFSNFSSSFYPKVVEVSEVCRFDMVTILTRLCSLLMTSC